MLYGTHGTCVSRAESIREKGFQPSRKGRVGPGVYAWAYISDSGEAIKLGYFWWKQETKRSAYRNEQDQDCAILSLRINVDQEEQLNFSRPGIEEACKVVVGRKLDYLGDVSQKEKEEAISETIATFVKDLEQELGVTFRVLIARVPGPTKMPYELGLWFGSSFETYIIRSGSVHLIDVMDCRRISDESEI